MKSETVRHFLPENVSESLTAHHHLSGWPYRESHLTWLHQPHPDQWQKTY